jgi:hypothetical protein
LTLSPQHTQSYLIEVWIEKSTMSELLEPLAQEYRINLVTGQGEVGDEACRNLIDRAEESGLPARVLWVSDFDAAGASMPLAMARKVEFWLRTNGHDDLDLQVRPIVLTKRQCEQFNLPETPMKPTERRKNEFFRKYGRDATELDALDALRPGEFEGIVRKEVERYIDPTLFERERKASQRLAKKVTKINNEVHDEFDDRYDELRDELEDWKTRFQELENTVESELNDRAPNLDEVEWPEPRRPDEDADPLFDSERDYVEQIDRYKEHQDKPTERKSGSPRRAARAPDHSGVRK